jgi:hypothetical protein
MALAVDFAILILPMIAIAISAAVLSLRVADPPVYRAARILLWGSESARMTEAWAVLAPLLVRLKAPGLPADAIVAVEKGAPDEAARVLSGYTLLFSLDIGESAEKEPPPKTIQLQVERLIPRAFRAMALFGVAAVYFTFCHASRRGQTVGKRLLRIRVVQLGEERLPLLESFERFAGYLEIPATLGLGLLSLWRDPNRRLPHDRVVHTAVLRVPRGTIQ